MTDSPAGSKAQLYDLDEAVFRLRPSVKLRGVEYRLADLTLERRLILKRKYFDTFIAITERERLADTRDVEIRAAIDERDKLATEPQPVGFVLPPIPEPLPRTSEEDWCSYKALGVQLALEGVPEDVARSLTEREFEVLQAIVRDADGMPVEFTRKNGDGASASGSSSPSPTPSAGSGAATPS